MSRDRAEHARPHLASWPLLGALAVALLAGVGCAPRQRIPLELGPEPVEVFVDGERISEPRPIELELESDRGHVVFVKKSGHRAEQVILRSVEQEDGPPRLEPGRIVVELRPEPGHGRRLEVELDTPLEGGGAVESAPETKPVPAGAASP